MPSKPASIPTLDFILDIQNPRFLTNQPKQEDVIRYLLKYSHVTELAKSISEYGSLYPGERIVTYKNAKGKYVVLEGNRRVCACQLFLKPDWIPVEYRSTFSTATPVLKKSIKSIDADVLKNRVDAESFLTSRHIGGVELWDPLAKKKFFIDRFETGSSTEIIAQNTNFSKTEIINDINEYYLFMKAYALPCWTKEQKENELNLYDIKIDLFLRIFNTRGAKKALELRYNKTSLQPESGLPGDIFSSAIERVMYCAYVTKNSSEKIDTRTRGWESVPGLKEILDSGKRDSVDDKSNDTAKDNPKNDEITSQNTQKQSSKSTSPEQNDSGSEKENPLPPVFFENLSWCGLHSTDPNNGGLIALAEEINEISKRRRGGAGYENYPIAATVLLRSLLEQALKYNLKIMDQAAYKKMTGKGYDPTLSGLIKEYRNNMAILLPEGNIQRTFSVLFSKDDLKDYLDLTTHHTSFICPAPETLERYAKEGLFMFINHILSKQFPS